MYSIDFRKKAVEFKREGHTFKELKEIYKIPPQTFYNWAKDYDDHGFEKPKAPVQRSRKIDKEKLKQAVKEQPNACLHELAEQFECTPQAVFYMIKKLQLK